MTAEAGIPFEGFYNSPWDKEIDSIAEREAEYMASAEGEYSDFEVGEVSEVVFSHTDHKAIYLETAKLYVDAWQDIINEELGIDIHLSFKEMVSPREYNFITDRLFVDISRDDIAQVYKKVGRQRLGDMAKRMFTSRSGFISFYRPDISEWGPVREWDSNQIGCLMEAAGEMVGDTTWPIFEAIQEGMSNAYQSNVDWEGVDLSLKHLRDIENGEAVEDARKFPTGIVKDVQEYVRQYTELNHLKGA